MFRSLFFLIILISYSNNGFAFKIKGGYKKLRSTLYSTNSFSHYQDQDGSVSSGSSVNLHYIEGELLTADNTSLGKGLIIVKSDFMGMTLFFLRKDGYFIKSYIRLLDVHRSCELTGLTEDQYRASPADWMQLWHNENIIDGTGHGQYTDSCGKIFSQQIEQINKKLSKAEKRQIAAQLIYAGFSKGQLASFGFLPNEMPSDGEDDDEEEISGATSSSSSITNIVIVPPKNEILDLCSLMVHEVTEAAEAQEAQEESLFSSLGGNLLQGASFAASMLGSLFAPSSFRKHPGSRGPF